MRTTLTEDLLLVLQDERGRSRAGSAYPALATAGAALAELSLDGAVRLTGPGEPGVKAGRLVTTGEPPSDERLTPLLGTLHGRTPKSAVQRLAGWSMSGGAAARLRDDLLTGLAARGALERREHRVLGLFPTVRWVPGPDAAPRDDVTARLRAALTGTGVPDPRTAALVSMLLATDALPKVLPDLDRTALKRRAREIADGEWAGAAVRKAVEEVYAAVATTAAVSAATAATS